jgi:large subunit ribosomal protein L2
MVIRKLTTILKKNSGRNNSGKITSRHRGGRHKRLYRMISFNNRLQGVARVLKIEYDPNRTGRIALLWFSNGILCYMLCADNVCQGQKLLIGGSFTDRVARRKTMQKNKKTLETPQPDMDIYTRYYHHADFQEGNVLPLRNIPLGSWVFNIAISKNRRTAYGRAAGVYLKLVTKKIAENNVGFAGLSLPSGQMLFVDIDVKATLGRVSNVEHKLKKLEKAGENRWRGWRPSVRGVAMNPVDHPHGGGEGKTSGGRPSVSAWGRLTKGYKTKKKRKIVKAKIIKRRRNKLENYIDFCEKNISVHYHKERYFSQKKPNHFKKRYKNDKINIQTRLHKPRRL